MVAVRIDSGPVSATDSPGDVSLARWPELLRARRMFCAVHLPYDCRQLLTFVEQADQMFGPLGYSDVDDFLRRGLELEPELVAWAIDGLKQLKPDEAIPFERAVSLGKREIGISGGKPGPGRGHKTNARNRRLTGSTNVSYLLARFDRDHPELAARVRSGELKAKTAARLAGIIRDKTPLEQLHYWWKKATPDDRLEFLRGCRHDVD